MAARVVGWYWASRLEAGKVVAAAVVGKVLGGGSPCEGAQAVVERRGEPEERVAGWV